MVFNSFSFLVFFVIVYLLYLAFQGHLKLQNKLIFISSSFFYGWWDWRFLPLMYFTIFIDFYIGRSLSRTDREGDRKRLLFLCICSNMIILGIFKYYNFFISSFEKSFSFFGLSLNCPTLRIILPVGISFYTFQSMSYVIDVYRKQLTPAKNILDYGAYVTYFPQLVAGPIERASHLLPQMLNSRRLKLDEFYEGCYLIFWGFFKKMFIADNLAQIVNPIFSAPPPYHGAQVLLGVYAFTFQIYCDFSGYSDIARGLGKMMGFDIMLNFDLPYFATNPSDFWKRWHISLSTWLRDYIYIPLGGNHKGGFFTYGNLMIVMLLGGLWHGASWHFVFWGAYHGLLLCVYKLLKPYFTTLSEPQSKLLRKVWHAAKIIFFFHLICLGWLFFRAGSLTQITEMLYAIFMKFHAISGLGLRESLEKIVFFTFLLLIVQLFQNTKKDLMTVLKAPVIARALFYLLCFYALTIFGDTGAKEFIYFQF